MFTFDKLKSIRGETLAYWEKEACKPHILDIAKGKEIGHKLADIVDEKTTALLTINHDVAHQRDASGKKRPRSMGDLWLKDNGIYHAINVKTGITGVRGGQPNLVSLKKVLQAIMARQIDSYYLLIVKMSIDDDSITPSVYFFDMLDWLDYVTFDSGPGQMMLLAEKFYSNYDSSVRETADIKDKLKKLMCMYADGERRLEMNRARLFTHYQNQFESFMNNTDITVTADTQRGINLR